MKLKMILILANVRQLKLRHSRKGLCPTESIGNYDATIENYETAEDGCRERAKHSQALHNCKDLAIKMLATNAASSMLCQ